MISKSLRMCGGPSLYNAKLAQFCHFAGAKYTVPTRSYISSTEIENNAKKKSRTRRTRLWYTKNNKGSGWLLKSRFRVRCSGIKVGLLQWRPTLRLLYEGTPCGCPIPVFGEECFGSIHNPIYRFYKGNEVLIFSGFNLHNVNKICQFFDRNFKKSKIRKSPELRKNPKYAKNGITRSGSLCRFENCI